MKLLTKTTFYFFLALAPLLAAAGYLLFSQFNRQLNNRVDKELVAEEIQWIRYLQTATANGSRFILRSPDLLIFPAKEAPAQYPQIWSTGGNKSRQIPYRLLRHVVAINGVPYEITIRKSQEQKAALVTNITWTMLLVFFLLFAATLVFNWLISKTIWRPFRQSLQTIRNLELDKLKAVQFTRTSIAEFNELNTALNTMTAKISADYLNMKEFTENAAHEMQTPLAVAQSKLELLLQDATLNEEHLEAISQTTVALDRLRKLNQSLLLLAKIENKQYDTNEVVDLVAVTEKYLRLFDEIIRDKNLVVQTSFDAAFRVNIHPLLADSLVSNLLGNAVKYNYTGGRLFITIGSGHYCLGNTSKLPPIEKKDLFRRFRAGGPNNVPSTGLGLAIVKRIADTHQLTVTYKAKDEVHQFCLQKS